MTNFPRRFLRWVTDKMNGDQEAAKRYCRDYWNKYGVKTIMKATKQKSCTNLYQFERLCKEIDKK